MDDEEIEFEMVVPLPTPEAVGGVGQAKKGVEEGGDVWWVDDRTTGEKVCEAWWVGV